MKWKGKVNFEITPQSEGTNVSLEGHTHPGGGGTWGTISGTLSNQTDLQSALNLKADNTAVVYNTGDTINGDLFINGAGNHMAIGTATPNNASLYIKPEAGLEWFRAGTGGDAGAWVLYEAARPIMYLTDYNDPPGIVLQQVGTGGTESSPDHKVEWRMSSGLSSNTQIRINNTNRFEIESDGTLNVSGTANYETLITGDDDIPNKKYVDDNAGSGDVSSSANITDNRIVRGDGGAKGVQESDWTIADNGRMSVSTTVTGSGEDHFLVHMHNTGTNYAGGLFIQAGESEGDIALRIKDENLSFHILDVHANNGQFVLGDSYDNALTTNGGVYGIDNQHDSGNAMDFNTQGGVYRIGGKATVMMTEFQDASSDSESSTTSTTEQTKLTLTTGSLPSGKYRVGWYYEWNGSATNQDVEIQVYDGATVLSRTEQAPEDSDAWHGYGGFCYRSSISGVHNFYIKYKTQSSSATARIRRARLEIWRVS